MSAQLNPRDYDFYRSEPNEKIERSWAFAHPDGTLLKLGAGGFKHMLRRSVERAADMREFTEVVVRPIIDAFV